jgi:hypothetical protein
MRRLLALLLVAVAAVPQALGAMLQASAEYEIKAAFLLNFAKFVDWPPRAFAGPDGPLRVCVLGDDPFGPILDRMLRDERIGGLRLTAARVANTGEAHGCHILYVAVSEEPRYGGILQQLDLRRVLTVGDSPAFLEHGGHIRFFLESDYVRFAVNPEAVARTEFQMSSKLLRVATIERPARGGGTR